ncbi:restriction endonuclease subunit S [Acinetobacter junii]|uniref:restriction endonuclease subunit S n=1 Tax=Acinetobacter junii TaxID=40215 RepID=UPI003AF6359A
MAKYQKYAEYNDSGVEWLGAIPKSWQVKKLKYLCKVTTGSKDTVNAVEDGKYPFFVRSQTVERINSVGADCEAVLTAGDGVGVGKVYHYYKGKFDFHQRVYMLYDFGTVTGRFVYYYLSSNFYKVALEGNAKSTVDSLRLPQFLNFEFSLPTVKEQNYVVDFLDHETTKIDTLIAKQEKLIELLKEKRQAVISHAVTKGLNPNVPMKDSGVEWLGEVPEHWKVIKFNHVVQIRNGLVDPRDDKFKNLILYAPNHIEKATGKILYKETAEEQGADSNKYLCFKGEVIYSKIRPALAKVAICEEATALCSADMYPMDSYNGLSNQFLYYFILSDSFTEAVILDSDRVAMPKINRESLSDYKLPIPPMNEQLKIIDFIEMTGKYLDCLETKAVQAIQLMQERRTALISAAVTGKIDVRNWQNPDKKNEADTELSA